MRLLLNILLGFVFLLGITSSEGCKSNKVPVEVEETVIEEVNPLDALLAGLHPLTDAELNGRMVTIDGVSLPVYDEKGNGIKGADIVDLFRDESKIFKIYGGEDLEPKVVLVRDRTAEDDIVNTPTIGGGDQGEAPMETKLEYAPAFKAMNMQGEEVELISLVGKVVVINFWFIQCSPCIEEMPELNSLVKKYKDEDVVFLAITHDSKEKVAAFLEKTSFDYDILPDGESIINDYIVMGFPTNIVLDKKGDIQYQSMGFRHKIDAILNDEIRHALKKKED